MRTIADAPRPALPPPPPGTPAPGRARTAPAAAEPGSPLPACRRRPAPRRAHSIPPPPRPPARRGAASLGIPGRQTLTSVLPSPPPPMPFTASAASSRPLCCRRRRPPPAPPPPPPPLAPSPAGAAGQGHRPRRPPPPPPLRPPRGPPPLLGQRPDTRRERRGRGGGRAVDPPPQHSPLKATGGLAFALGSPLTDAQRVGMEHKCEVTGQVRMGIRTRTARVFRLLRVPPGCRTCWPTGSDTDYTLRGAPRQLQPLRMRAAEPAGLGGRGRGGLRGEEAEGRCPRADARCVRRDARACALQRGNSLLK